MCESERFCSTKGYPSKRKIWRQGRLSSLGPVVSAWSVVRTSMYLYVEFVLVPCQSWLCNSYIKEKLTLMVQLINACTDGDRQTDRQMDTHTNIKEGSGCTQLQFCACACLSFFCVFDIGNTYTILYVQEKLFLRNVLHTFSLLPILVCSFPLFFAIYMLSL